MSTRILIAADPGLAAELTKALPRPEFHIEAAIHEPAELLPKVKDTRPQLVLLQLGLAKRDGHRCVQDLMAFAPTPILLVAGHGEDPAEAFEALAMGALDAVRYTEGQAVDLARRARLLAGVRVITHVRARRAKAGRNDITDLRTKLVAVGASLGGPRALAQLLHDLRGPLPAPILIVQHISDGFSEGLAHWLAVETGTPVREVTHQMPLTPGLIAVAPSGKQMEVREGKALLLDDPPDGGFKPSVSTMFRSVARHYGQRGVGVILTGMGQDGADGLLEMRRQGARTFAQDEATCVVFGMPRAAWELGAVESMLPLDQLAIAIRRAVEG
ncbi:MAG: chemotaxis response regulator protein-glutamate methylesterase [Deltaproteobacteria bacterium]|nr:chemotaxis response regulator protein-glutamate methylesterase [Deltaproteobacteria bacterium]